MKKLLIISFILVTGFTYGQSYDAVTVDVILWSLKTNKEVSNTQIGKDVELSYNDYTKSWTLIYIDVDNGDRVASHFNFLKTSENGRPIVEEDNTPYVVIESIKEHQTIAFVNHENDYIITIGVKGVVLAPDRSKTFR